MNAAETLQAAIDRLTELRAASGVDPWTSMEELSGDDAPILRPVVRAGKFWVAATNEAEDAELIVTLHRTIDAQLAMLSAAVQDVTGRDDDDARMMWPLEIRLARAILGGDS